MSTSNDHPRRTVDIRPWFPFAWIEENGRPVSRDLPVFEFTIAVYVRNAIMRAMRRNRS